jgi:hypothetical protein
MSPRKQADHRRASRPDMSRCALHAGHRSTVLGVLLFYAT